MPSLLLEIGAEELPAAACREAEAQLPELAHVHIGAAPSQLFVGPRRVGFLIDDLPERTADEWVKGPPENLRERAAVGFAKKHGVKVEELELREGFLGITVPGRELREVLPAQIDRIVRGFSFKKSMRWDESGIRFARPVRWVLAKLDGETIVGETSFGKGTVQQWIPLQNGSALKLTIAKWLTPDKHWIHHVGIVPDVPVATPADASPTNDPVLDKAVELLTKA